MLLIFAACHLFAMTSVVFNSILYGFLNDNFKKVKLFIVPSAFQYLHISEFTVILPSFYQDSDNKKKTSIQIHKPATPSNSEAKPRASDGRFRSLQTWSCCINRSLTLNSFSWDGSSPTMEIKKQFCTIRLVILCVKTSPLWNIYGQCVWKYLGHNLLRRSEYGKMSNLFVYRTDFYVKLNFRNIL